MSFRENPKFQHSLLTDRSTRLYVSPHTQKQHFLVSEGNHLSERCKKCKYQIPALRAGMPIWKLLAILHPTDWLFHGTKRFSMHTHSQQTTPPLLSQLAVHIRLYVLHRCFPDLNAQNHWRELDRWSHKSSMLPAGLLREDICSCTQIGVGVPCPIANRHLWFFRLRFDWNLSSEVLYQYNFEAFPKSLSSRHHKNHAQIGFH